MRIDLVSEHASPLTAITGVDAGGQNVHVAALGLALCEGGDEVVVHTRRDAPDMPDRVEVAPGLVVNHVPAGPAAYLPKDGLLTHMPEFGRHLRDAWRDDAPDLVHTHFWMSAVAAMAPARAMGIPMAHTFHALGTVKRRHQGAADTSPPERIDIERRIAAEADLIVAMSSDERRELEGMGAHPSRVAIVPSGVDPAVFRPDGPRVPGAADGRARIVCLGRLVPRKGVDDVIRSLPRVPGAELMVLGGPPASMLDRDAEVRRLRALAHDVGVDDRVRFTGAVARAAVPRLLRSADVVACTPWYEPFGIVPLEAMACGVPVVGSRTGGLMDTVLHGRTGLLVPPRNVGAIAAALSALIANPGWRRELGARAAVHVRSTYAWPEVGRATRAVYEGLTSPAESTLAVGRA